MPTTQTKVVRVAGGAGADYTSLASWESGEQANLVTGDLIKIAQCECTDGAADTALVDIIGWTTSATQYIKVWTNPAVGYRHPGKWATGNVYRLAVTNPANALFSFREEFIYLDGIEMQIKMTGGGTTPILNITQIGATNLGTITNCIFRKDPTSTSGTATGVQANDADAIVVVNNCVADGCDSSGFLSNTSSTMSVYNCTAVNNSAGYGYRRVAGDMTVVNGIAQDCATAAFSGTFNANSNYNLDDDATAPGANSVHSTTLTFVDKANHNYHLGATDNAAFHAGVGPSSDANVPTTDIDGNPRAGTTSDIGADEVMTRTVTEASTVAENLTVTVTATGNLSISISDAATVAENIARTMNEGPVSKSESVSVAENISRAMNEGPVSISDASTVAESITVSMPLAGVSISDAVTVAENISSFIALGSPSVNDAAAVSESVTASMPLAGISINDSATVSDEAIANIGSDVSINDTATVSESVTVSMKLGDVFVFDASGVTDVLTVARTDAVDVGDDSTVTEDISVNINTDTSIGDDSTVSEDVSVFIDLAGIDIHDNVSLTDSASTAPLESGFACVDDSIATDELFVELGLEVAVDDSSSVSEVLSGGISSGNTGNFFPFFIGGL